MAGTKKQPQIHMDDNIIKDPELEKLLEDRESLKSSAADYRKADKSAKEKLKAIETPTPYRVGRFVITRNDTSGRHVEFDVQSSFRFNIKIAEAE